MNETTKTNIPRHVAIILDGNGRWAKKRGLPRSYGHVEGAKTIEAICEDADDIGIKYLTVYAFSTENWRRSPEEVAGLMKLFSKYMKNNLKKAQKNNMRMRFIGDRSGLSASLCEQMAKTEEETKQNTGLNFQIAINYGGRDELVRAAKKVAEKVADGVLKAEEISEIILNECLDTADIPDPDLLIRTCNEQRLSNFLLWQLAYTELYFVDVLWPDFSRADLEAAVKAYGGRERKYGGVK